MNSTYCSEEIKLESNETSIGKEKLSLVVEETVKSDSGMEDEFLNPATGLSDSSDVDMEEIGLKKLKKKRRMIFDDEDKEEDVAERLDDSNNDLVSDIVNDDNEEDKDSSTKNLSSAVDSESPTNKKSHHLDLKTNVDLFDAELSDEEKLDKSSDDRSEDDADSRNSDVSGNDTSNDSNDEGFEENQLNPKLLAKLKKLKGAGKKERKRTTYERKSKPTAEQMTEIYSESQRLLRETRVNVPYYEPEAKSLNDFLARASMKKQEYSGLKRAKDIVKAQIIQEKLSVPVLPSPPSKMKLKIRVLAEPDGQSDATTPAFQSSTFMDVPVDSGVSSQDLAMSQGQGLSTASSSDIPQMGEDELPDIVLNNLNLPAPSQIDESLSDLQVLSPQTNPSSEEEVEPPLILASSLEEPNQAQILQQTSKNCSQSVTESNCNDLLPKLKKDTSMDLFDSANSVLNENPMDNLHSNVNKMLNEVDTIAKQKADDSFQEELPNKTETPSDTATKRKKSLLERLQGIELPSLPHLSGSPSDVISLAEPTSETPQRNPGLLKLIHKFAEHSKPRTLKAAQTVNLSIISKEGEEGTRKELKLHSVIYNVEQEEDILVNDTPGSKLVKLKQQLDAGMKVKREEARNRRQQLYALENEEGFEGQQAEEELEEEEDMTESSSEEDEEDDEPLLQNFEDDSDDRLDYNPLLDNEAAEDSDEEAENDNVSNREEDVNENSNDIHLHFDASDDNNEEDKEESEENSEDESEEEIRTSVKKRVSKPILDDEESADAEADQPAQNQGLLKETFSQAILVAPDPLIGLWSSEDTGRETDYQSQSQCNSASHVENSDSSQYLTPWPVLDKDGLIKVTQRPSLSHQEHASKMSSLLQSGDTQLLPENIFNGFGSQKGSQDLSPGKVFKDFSTQKICSHTLSPGNIFHDFQTQPASKDIDLNISQEHSGLSSFSRFGKSVVGKEKSQAEKQFTNSIQTQPFKVIDDDYDENDIYDPFSVLSNKEDNPRIKKHKRIKHDQPVLTESEGEEDNNSDASIDHLSTDEDEKSDRSGDTDIEEDSNQSEKPLKFTGFKDKYKGIRKEFIEDEAELSGSEEESDEDLDIAETDDILEEEEGDKDLMGVSEEQLREEVGRVHMKHLQDDDDKEIMFFKERYLQDGDLYSEGTGRLRNFRWKNSDANSQQDMFNISDDEQQEEDKDEQQWRKDRYEREKFLEENDPQLADENSQLLKLGQVFLKKKESSITKENIPAPKQKMLPPEPPKPQLSKKGSFLSRKDDSLVKLAQSVKTLGTAARGGKNFIFQSIDQQESQEDKANKDGVAPAKRKAHKASQPEQPAKKARLPNTPADKNLKRRDSIFQLLE